MRRRVTFVLAAAFLGAFLSAAVVTGTTANATAEFTVDGVVGGRIISTGRDLTVVMGPSSACYVDELWLMDEVRDGGLVTYRASKRVMKNGIPVPLATNKDVNKVIPLPNIPAGTEIVFGIVPNAANSDCGPATPPKFTRQGPRATIYVTGPLTRNPDLFPHNKVNVAGGVAYVGLSDTDRRTEVDQNSTLTGGPCPNTSIPWTISRLYTKTPGLPGYFDPTYAGGPDDYWYATDKFDTDPADSHAVAADYRPAWCPDWNDMTFWVRARKAGDDGGPDRTPRPTPTPKPTPTRTPRPTPTPTPIPTPTPTPTPAAAQDCTLTIGYWKNHAGFGPQANVLGPLLPVSLGSVGGAHTVTVQNTRQAVSLLDYSGSSSNGIDKLYGQLLAAKLNHASGASTTAIAATLATSDAILAAHGDGDWATLGAALQAQVLGLVSTLDQYNNGLIGPGHCR